MPTLYIVSTPIGNLEDITLRALRVLGEAGLIAAEDTRVTRKLLSHYDIHTPLTSFNEHNRVSRVPELLKALCEADVALVSDAGTPGVNDPGKALVTAAAVAGIQVVAVPGASAVTAAVAVSGLVDEPFVYLGFLPRKKSERTRLIASLRGEQRPAVFFESPRRLRRALQEIASALGDRPLAICREMTKVYEEVFRGTASDALAYFDSPRGEFTLVLAGAETDAGDDRGAHEMASILLDELRLKGDGARHAIEHVYRSDRPVKARGVPDVAGPR